MVKVRNAVTGAPSALPEQEVDTAGYLPTPGPVDGMRVDRARDIPASRPVSTSPAPTASGSATCSSCSTGGRRTRWTSTSTTWNQARRPVGPARPGPRLRPAFDRYEALSVALRPGFLGPATVAAAHVDSLTAPAVLRGTPAEQTLVTHGLDRLREEYDHRTGLPPDTATELVRHCLSALLLRLSQVTGARPTEAEPHPLATAFRAAVEADFARTRSVTEYAHRLGCSRRTLATVVGQAAGHTPRVHRRTRRTGGEAAPGAHPHAGRPCGCARRIPGRRELRPLLPRPDGRDSRGLPRHPEPERRRGARTSTGV